MKTMKNLIGMKGLMYVALVLFIFLASCSDNNKIDYTATDNANVQSETNTDAQTEEADDMSAVAMTSSSSTLSGREDQSGRTEETITVSDDRLKCAIVTLVKFTDNSLTSPHGTITIDFGTGCTGPAGKIRKGQIIIVYKGRRFLPGSSIVITFNNYFVNGIKVEGTRTLTNTSASETAPVSF